MNVSKTSIAGLYLIEPKVFEDERGYFFESYSKTKLESSISNIPNWVQDNESLSKKGVLRGLHFQKPPHAQDKLVRVVKGAVLDVAIDLRLGSETFGKWESFVLSGKNKKQLLVPAGFAHGFLVIEDDTLFCYKCSAGYHGPSEETLRWDDPTLDIDWQLDKYLKSEPFLSQKDVLAPLFKDFQSPFHTSILRND